MVIKKVLNNNAALIEDESGLETIVLGLGIAFKKKNGDTIDVSKIEKKFVLSEKEVSLKLQHLVTTMPIEYVMTSNDIIKYAKSATQWNFSDIIYITLTDHISGAIDRHNKGIELKNALTWDVEQLYEEEFKIGQVAIKMIADKYGIYFDDDEAAYIAMHFLNARINRNEDLTMVNSITGLIKQLADIVKEHFQFSSFQKSFEYNLFISYLKNISQKAYRRECECNIRKLSIIAGEEYPEAFKCVKKIKKILEVNYDYKTNGEDELLLCIFLTHMIEQNSLNSDYK